MAAAVLMSACSTQPVNQPDRHAQTSYQQVVAPTGASSYVLEPGETAIGPTLDKQVAPIYPPSLVNTGAAPVTVVAQLVMDKQGHVSAVHPNSDTDSDPEGALFEAAVEHAAMQWTFTPFWVQQPRQDGTYLRTPMPFSLWYTFEFKMVNGKPQVEVDKR